MEVRAIPATSSAASRVETATYLAAEPKPGAAVGNRQIVVHRFGQADALQRVIHPPAQLRQLQRRVHGIVAAVEEHHADVMGPENIHQAPVFALVVRKPGELVAGRAERAPGPGAQRRHLFRRRRVRVKQLLVQGAEDAIARGKQLADRRPGLPHRFDDALGGGVDYRRGASGLRIKSVAGWHGENRVA